MKFLAIIATLAMSFTIQAQTISQTQKDRLAQDMNFVGQIFENYYAPKAWKEAHVGWNLSAELQKAQNTIQKANTIREYRGALVEFLKSTADYHVGFNFYSTETATLPFQVKTVEGKSIFVFIDRKKLPVATFPFQTGDELIAMDGVPMAKLLGDIKMEIGKNVPGTDNAMADLTVASRSGRRNNVVPTSVVTLTIQRAKETKTVEQQIAWDYTPESIAAEVMSLATPVDEPYKMRSPMMVSPEAQDFASSQAAANNFSVGVRESFLPDFGTRIWETEATNTFDAYIYKNEQGKLIGVVRISKYYEPDHSLASAQFAQIITRFQKVTDSMIIDQNNNPGGSVFYLYGLVSMLTDTAFSTPKHRIALSASDVNEAVGDLAKLKNVKNDEDAIKAFGASEVHGYPLNFSFAMAVRDFSNFIVSQWEQGKKLSDPYFLYGVDKINPHPTARYTKPIVLLVNELDFSGGDFFPAILQDNKRVTIVGARTAGAGGYVGSFAFPNSFGLSTMNFTGSIAERVDKNPIENLGVTPDIQLNMTLDDYRNNFATYMKEVKAVVQKVTP